MLNHIQETIRKLSVYPVGLYLGITNKRYGRSHRITHSKTYEWIDTVGANYFAEKIKKSELTDNESNLEITVLETNGKFKHSKKGE